MTIVHPLDECGGSPLLDIPAIFASRPPMCDNLGLQAKYSPIKEFEEIPCQWVA